MKEIRPLSPMRVALSVPGSKSYTHRAFIAAALAEGSSEIEGALWSEDTRLTREALCGWGARFTARGPSWAVAGTAGRLVPAAGPVRLGNSGTSMRLLTAVAALVAGESLLVGSPRLEARPVGELVSALAALGVAAECLRGNGCPPVRVCGGRLPGGRVRLDCSRSSQFLSALLLAAPYSERGIEIEVARGPVSRPYLDITVDVLKRFGVAVERKGWERFRVEGGGRYRACRFAVEADCSQAGYFWAAAAVTGSAVTVRGTRRDSLQGDVRLLDLLAAMGCRVEDGEGGVRVTGGELRAVDADLGDLPDAVPTLAVVAAYARGESRIRNVGHLRDKESDRLAAVCEGLSRMGIRARVEGSELRVTGGRPRGAAIDCHDDHRIAMSFAVAGLGTPGVRILDEACVAKSFPGFWGVFEELYGCAAAPSA